MHVPKSVIVACIAALGVLGIGVAAATVEPGGDASGPGSDEPTTTVPVTTVPVTTVPVAPQDGVDAPDDGNEPDDVDGAAVERYYGPECGEEIPGGTHGDYVSRAAQDPTADVSAMAQSSCGRPLVSVHSNPTPAAGQPEGAGKPEEAGNPHGDPPGQTAPGQTAPGHTEDHGPPEGHGPTG
jgi:hypothetical protein